MGYAVFDASYWPSNQLGVAAQMVKDGLGIHYDPSGKSGALVSSVHPQQAVVVERIARKYGEVWVGGPGALSPGNYESATGVCLGDYNQFLSMLVSGQAYNAPNVYIPTQTRTVEIDQSFPYNHSGQYRGEDG